MKFCMLSEKKNRKLGHREMLNKCQAQPTRKPAECNNGFAEEGGVIYANQVPEEDRDEALWEACKRQKFISFN